VPLAPKDLFARAASHILDQLADYFQRVAAEFAAAFAPRGASHRHFGLNDTLDWLNLWQAGGTELTDDLSQVIPNNHLSPDP
jgi:hypothetical protein